MTGIKKTVVVGSMAVLGAVMIGLGLFAGEQIVPPPIVTGVGFWVLAWGHS